MTPAETPAEILRTAADRVQFQGWTTGTYARNSEGTPVRTNHPEAAAWCARGALKAAAPSPYWFSKALYAFAKYLDSTGQLYDVMLWNDQIGRTAGEVADAMRLAAKTLENAV